MRQWWKRLVCSLRGHPWLPPSPISDRDGTFPFGLWWETTCGRCGDYDVGDREDMARLGLEVGR